MTQLNALAREVCARTYALRGALLLVLAATAGPLFAQEENPPDQMGVTMEPANSGASAEGEFIDPLTGHVSHEITELVLPGNAGLDIRVTRAFGKSPQYAKATPFAAAAWDIVVPRVSLTLPDAAAWCNDPAVHYEVRPSGPHKMVGTGIVLTTPGDQARSLVDTGGAPRYLTTDFWKADCIAADGVANKGFKVTSPKGITYYFDVTFIDSSPPYTSVRYEVTQGVYLNDIFPPFISVHLVPSRVEDLFGNYISYEYLTDPNGRRHVSRISANDERTVTFGYHDAGQLWKARENVFLIDWFASGGRTWTFQYEGAHMKGVTRPDGSKYEYTYGGHAYNDVAGNYLASAKYPSGATITYGAIKRDFTVFKVWGISSKTWSDGQDSFSKAYSYSSAGTGLQYTTINTSTNGVLNGTRRLTVDNSNGSSRARVVKSEVLSPTGVELEETVYVHSALKDLGDALLHYGLYNGVPPARASTENVVVLDSRTITRGADTFLTTFSQYDTYGKPRSIIESSSQGTLETSLTYASNPNTWILGAIQSVKVRMPTGSMYETKLRSFDSLGRPYRFQDFGLVRETRGYDANGNVAWKADGLDRRTEYPSYHRGSPTQTVFHDGSSVQQTINYFGEQVLFTDENGHATEYQRDGLGLVKRINYPTGDVQAWTPRLTSRSAIDAQTFGHPVGTWQETTTQGRYETRTFYSGAMRPLHVRERDMNSGVVRNKWFRYDADGRQTFESDWDWGWADSAPGAGTSTSYDALGRVIQRVRSSGAVLEQRVYLSGNRQQITDADGKVTTITYQAFGEPEYERPLLIVAPEGQTTSIDRDKFGKILSVTQAGTYNGSSVSATRLFKYDQFQRLCGRLDPEAGSTLFGYDSARQVVWQAKGQPNLYCLSEAPADATIFEYDDRGRKTKDSYADVAEAVIYRYDAVGNLTSVINAAAVWSYTYNKRNLLETESALIDGREFVLDPSYDTLGNVAALTTPSRTISYQPDAWGRPASLGFFATAINYHPNGIPASYLLGNDVRHTLSLNDRQWPELQVAHTYNGYGVPVQKFRYSYSSAGDLISIDDEIDGADDATLTYDGLHRLKTAASPLWGNYAYVYDPLNNLRQRSGPNGLTYLYNGSNRLASVSGALSRVYGYNNRGEIIGDGVNIFTLNGNGQIVRVDSFANSKSAAALPSALYSYDGNGKRVKTIKRNGAVEYALYNRAGALVYTHAIQPLDVSAVGIDMRVPSAPATQTDYVNLNGQPLAEVTVAGIATSVQYLHPDLLGSPRMATGGSAQTLWREHYDPYGNKLNGNIQKIGYAGHAHDQETGLTYMQARFYDAAVGRFLSIDPEGFEDSSPFTFNRYSYANNNPYKYVDPNGASVWTMLGKLIWKGGDIAATTAGIVEDAATMVNPAAPLTSRIGAALSLASELAPVSARDAKAVANVVSDMKAIPDSHIVVRGGTGDVPPPGQVFSGSAGETLQDAAQGVPNGQIRDTTAGKIREGGGTVESAPERTRSGAMNKKHVHVCLGCDSQPFSELKPNPVPKVERIK